MFEFLKKSKKFSVRKPKNTVAKIADYNSLAFIEKLMHDLTKWKFIAFGALLVLVLSFFWCNGGKGSSFYSENFIAEIEIDGVIETDKYRSKVLKELAENKNLKGVFLKINSPGGTITGSEILYKEIKKLSKKVPVYALIYDLGASGGYMTALGATKIYSYETSITGSIGVLMQTLQLEELSKKIGARVKVYRSVPFKAQPDSFEKTSPEVDFYMQTSIEESHKFFANLVAKERKLTAEEVFNVANGKIYMGSEALRLKLIDGISEEQAVKSALIKKVGKLEFEEISLKEEEEEGFVSQIIDDILKKKSKESSKSQVMAIMKI